MLVSELQFVFDAVRGGPLVVRGGPQHAVALHAIRLFAASPRWPPLPIDRAWNPRGQSGEGRGTDQLISVSRFVGEQETFWMDLNFAHIGTSTLHLGISGGSRRVASYELWTSPRSECDPVSWRLFGRLTTDSAWVQLDSRNLSVQKPPPQAPRLARLGLFQTASRPTITFTPPVPSAAMPHSAPPPSHSPNPSWPARTLPSPFPPPPTAQRRHSLAARQGMVRSTDGTLSTLLTSRAVSESSSTAHAVDGALLARSYMKPSADHRHSRRYPTAAHGAAHTASPFGLWQGIACLIVLCACVRCCVYSRAGDGAGEVASSVVSVLVSTSSTALADVIQSFAFKTHEAYVHVAALWQPEGDCIVLYNV